MNVAEHVSAIKSEMAKAVVGQSKVVDQMLTAVLANGHVLLEGVPGVAKTLMVRTLANTVDLTFRRIQFTPDLMPSDVIGTNVFDPQTTSFKLRTGPIFTNVLLADEINRTPPKTQAALLEAMEERQATIDGDRHVLPQPFLVFATQNPIEFEGTYPLPEAQQDRFLMKVLVDYAAPSEERVVLQKYHAGFRSQDLETTGMRAVVDQPTLTQMRDEVNQVQVEDKIFDYILSIVLATRNSHELQYGASPRAGLAMLSCAKAVAAMRGRAFVIPDDVKELTLPILRHRVMLRAEIDTQGVTVDEVITDLVNAQPVPR